MDERLRGPALAGDWTAWSEAWQALDAGPLAQLHAVAEGRERTERGERVRLTLCGERSAATFEPAVRGLWPRLRSAWSKPAVWPVLETL